MTAFDDLEPTEVEVQPILAAQMTSHCGLAPDEVKEAMGTAFGTVIAFLTQHGLRFAGSPRAIYTSFGPQGVDFTAAIPVATTPPGLSPSDPVTVASLPGAKALRFTHRGPYGELMTTYGRIAQYLEAKGLMKDEADWARYMPMWEEYRNDPDETPEADLLTHIFLPRT
ncbi:MAG: GyrI-like domain-containing protein [Thermoguttaceae bacterium]